MNRPSRLSILRERKWYPGKAGNGDWVANIQYSQRGLSSHLFLWEGRLPRACNDDSEGSGQGEL